MARFTLTRAFFTGGCTVLAFFFLRELTMAGYEMSPEIPGHTEVVYDTISEPRHRHMPGNEGKPDVFNGRCEVVHIAIPYSGSRDAQDLYHMLLTLFQSRQSQLYLHFVTTPSGNVTIRGLLDTWQIPAVAYSVYVDPGFKEDKNNDILKTKLLLQSLSTMFPSSLDKIIVLHPRVRLLNDLRDLWRESENFNSQQVMGMVSGFAVQRSDRHYFDVMLVLLNRYRKSLLSDAFQTAVLERWDHFHGLFSKFASYVYGLPCGWLVRLDGDFKLQDCLAQGQQPKLLWWGNDLYFSYGLIDHYIDIIRTRITADPNILRYTQSPCFRLSLEDSVPKVTSSEECSEFRFAVQLKKLTWYFYIGSLKHTKPMDKDVTLLTVFTMGRFDVFLRLLDHWSGPVTAVLYGDSAEAILLKSAVRKSLSSRTNIVFHMVFRREPFFPINYLRNVAGRYCSTEYAFYVDVDLVPNMGAYEYLKELVSKEKDDHVALVVPAFQAYEALDTIPANKSEMVKLITKNVISGYGMRRAWNLGHRPTMFEKWTTATESYYAKFADAFEPYVVVPVKTMGYYKELLFQRMGDKIGYALYLYHQGFRFKVIPGAFVIHLPHATGSDKTVWLSSGSYFRCGSVLITAFKDELKKKYPVDT